MTISSASENQNGTRRATDLQAFFAQRKNFAERDDNTPWLITLADLLAILLVFSLVLFSLMMPKKPAVAPVQAKKDFAGSFVSIAEAQTGSKPSALSIPAGLYQRFKSSARSSGDEEKIIAHMTINIPETQAPLSEGYKSDLQRIGELSRLNPDTKIIISVRMYHASAGTAPRVQDIIAFLTGHCGVDGKNILFTSGSSSTAGPGALSGESIEVSLVKEFWSL